MTPSEKAKDEVVRAGLAVCKECDRLEMGTCLGVRLLCGAARSDGGRQVPL